MTDTTLPVYRGPYEPVWTRHNSRYVVFESLYMASLRDHSQKLFESERRRVLVLDRCVRFAGYQDQPIE